MTFKISTALNSALWFSLTIAMSFGQSAQEIAFKAIPVQSLANYKAELESAVPTAVRGAKSNLVTHGVQYGLRIDGSLRQRTETEFSVAGVQSKIITIIENSNIYQIFPDQKRTIKIPVVGAADPYTVSLATTLANPTNFTYEMHRDRLDERNVDVIVMTLLKPALKRQEKERDKSDSKTSIPIIARQEKWIDTESHVILQLLAYDAEGRLISRTKYSNIQTNIDLPQSLFEIPGDYTQVTIDSHKDAIKQIVKETLASVSKQKFKPGLIEPSESQNTKKPIQYMLLGLVFLQGGLAIRSILRRRKMEQEG